MEMQTFYAKLFILNTAGTEANSTGKVGSDSSPAKTRRISTYPGRMKL
jgi:hypothetical protein